MNKEVRDLWVSALKSGKFKQGKGILAQKIFGEMYYCCWGVLCELAAEAAVIPPAREESYGVTYGNGSTAFIPDQVADWAGVIRYRNISDHSVNNTHKRLADLNDQGENFDVIAEVIQTNM